MKWESSVERIGRRVIHESWRKGRLQAILMRRNMLRCILSQLPAKRADGLVEPVILLLHLPGAGALKGEAEQCEQDAGLDDPRQGRQQLFFVQREMHEAPRHRHRDCGKYGDMDAAPCPGNGASGEPRTATPENEGKDD